MTHSANESGEPLETTELEDMTRWRRHLHARPELGFEEVETTAFIRDLLDEWTVPYSTPLPTATIAEIHGGLPGPTLVIRADIDALPVQEENDVPYASTRPGVMHACGHDGHTAIGLALVRSLARKNDTMRGNVRLIFQPAEELVDGGAVRLVHAGALDGATAALGLHLVADLPTGVIGLTSGAVNASDDRFDIRIIGVGGHVAYPHEATDALAIAAGLVAQIHLLASRRIDPLGAAVVQVGTLHAGSAYNVITGEALLSGTVRTLTPAHRDTLETDVTALAKAYAAAHGARAEVDYHRGAPPLINDDGAVDFFRTAAVAAVGANNVTAAAPDMGSDDFAFFGERVPSVYAVVGCAAGEGAFPIHHPRFDLDEKSLAVGLRFLEHAVDRWANPAFAVPVLQHASS